MTESIRPNPVNRLVRASCEMDWATQAWQNGLEGGLAWCRQAQAAYWRARADCTPAQIDEAFALKHGTSWTR